MFSFLIRVTSPHLQIGFQYLPIFLICCNENITNLSIDVSMMSKNKSFESYHWNIRKRIEYQGIKSIKMNKIFGSEDSVFYAENNSSWANDLALELG